MTEVSRLRNATSCQGDHSSVNIKEKGISQGKEVVGLRADDGGRMSDDGNHGMDIGKKRLVKKLCRPGWQYFQSADRM